MCTKRSISWKRIFLTSLILMLAASFYNPLPALALVDNGTWVVKAPMPGPRTEFGLAFAAGQVYAIGGVNQSSQPVPFVEAYDPVTDTWLVRTPLPVALTSVGATTVNGIIYAFGKQSFSNFMVYRYDPALNTWSQVLQTSNQRTGFSVVAGSDNLIYIIGGKDNSGFYVGTVLVFDPSTNLLNTHPSSPGGMSDFGATLGVDGKIYVVGGESGQTEVNTTQIFDPVAGTWTIGPSLPAARQFIKAASLQGKIYAVGGSLNNQVFRNVYELDPLAANPIWVERTSLLDTPETNAAVIQGLAAANGHLYAVGSNYNQEFTITPDAKANAAPSATDIFVGDPLTIDLTITDATELYAMQATCVIDPAVLTLQNGTFGTLFDPVDNLVGSNTADPLTGTWTGAISQRSPALPITGAGTMATLSFTAAGPGTTTITCTPLLSDKDGFAEPFVYTGATITVQAGTIEISGTVSYQGRLSHGGIQVTFTLNGNLEGSATTDASGVFALTLSTAGSYTVRAAATSYLPSCDTVNLSSGQILDLLPTTLLGGDTNGDETIDIGDATLLAANFGLAVPPAPSVVDINADALVNVQDLAILGGNYGLTGCQGW